MDKREGRFWKWLRPLLPPHWWAIRIENLVGDGMPDVWIGADRCHWWVELKAPLLPKRETTRLLGTDGLRQGQINWHVKAASKGLPSWVFVRDNDGSLYLAPGRDADELNDLPVRDMRRRYLTDLPTAIDAMEKTKP